VTVKRADFPPAGGIPQLDAPSPVADSDQARVGSESERVDIFSVQNARLDHGIEALV
jgi:hypothetical protein